MTRQPLIGITCDFEAGGPRPPRSLLYADYHDALAAHGALPVLLGPFDAEREAAFEALLDRLDGIVFTGGDDLDPRHYGMQPAPEVTLIHPRRQVFELTLARLALAGSRPILGLCNGVQLLNVVRGGTLVQHLDPADARLLVHRAGRPSVAHHRVSLQAGSRLAAIFGADSVRTNSYHHQSIDRPGQGCQVVGRTADGVIEALEVADHPWAVGVQWHPEKPPRDLVSARLFAAFVDAASP